MPSPFPGMDPYLEGSLWTRVHSQLASVFVRQLNPQIGPRYVAQPARRFVWEWPERKSIAIGENNPDPSLGMQPQTEPGPWGQGTIIPPIRMATLMRTRVPHVTIKIREVERRRLVAAIEVLSPTNKRREGRREYVHRRERFLRGRIHLLEIDLLRTGRRVPMAGELPSAPYFVFLGRVGHLPLMDVWPIRLESHLPTVPVPLQSGDNEARLDLQQALALAYDECSLGDMIDYSRAPEVSLTAEQSAWVDQHLRAAGLRR